MSSLAQQPIAITGLATITPLADEPQALLQALHAGASSIEDHPETGALASGRIADFDARRYATIRGMRVYPRNTQLQICAAVLALESAGLSLGAVDPVELGTITASTYAHLETLIEYDRGLVTVGIQRTNPTLFPLALPSAPGALTALSLGAKAFAITLSDGDASGLAALGLAARMLAQGRAKVCVVTGAWTHCAELALSAQRAGMLTSRAGLRPFDRHSRGTAFGELAASLVLEQVGSARARGREPLGYVRAHAAAFAHEPARLTHSLVRACGTALATAQVEPMQLSLVASGASGLAHADAAEARALHELLGDARTHVGVMALKSQLGESLDASGLLQTIGALSSMRAGIAPAIAGLSEPSVPGLRYFTRATEVAAGSALMTSISHAGACSALLVSVNA